MKQNHLILLLTLVACGIFMVDKAIDSKFSKVRNLPSIKQAQTKMVLPITAMMESAKVDGEDLKDVIVVELPKINDKTPSDENIREEVKNNVHSVPSSLLDFTVLVTAKMKQAKQNFVYADALFSEFRNCAASEEADQQNLVLRAYCLANAKRLVTWYPDLAARWESLSNQVGHRLLELVDMSQG